MLKIRHSFKYKFLFLLFLCMLLGIGIFFFLDKKRSPMISVIMSTYNREEFLPRAIDSILNQTYSDFEFIIIDDGSTDYTKFILKLYANKDSRIKIISHLKNKGLVFSLNEGLNLAKGKYIARMDDDDVSYLWRLQKQFDFMEKNPEITLAGSWISPLDSILPYPFQKERSPEKITALLEKGECPISHPSIIVKRSFLTENHIRYNPEYLAAEDRAFYADIIDAGGKATNIQETLLHYRLHSLNSSEYYMNQRKSILKFRQRQLKKNPNPDS